jgi:hypothetical protein
MDIIRHGTAYTYQTGCRCVSCRAAHAAMRRAYLDRRRAAGICLECPAPVVPGTQRCPIHTEANRARVRATLTRRRAALTTAATASVADLPHQPRNEPVLEKSAADGGFSEFCLPGDGFLKRSNA